MFYAGVSFWILPEPNPHLWFIISDPSADDRRVLYVNLTTFDCDSKHPEARNDPACKVYPGEHEFVTRVSCVYYYGAREASVDQLMRCYEEGKIAFREGPASAALLEKMRSCAGDSRFMVPDHYQILVDQNLAS